MILQHFFNINILSTSTICQHIIDINILSPSTLYRHQQIIDTSTDLFVRRQVFDKKETKRRQNVAIAKSIANFTPIILLTYFCKKKKLLVILDSSND